MRLRGFRQIRDRLNQNLRDESGQSIILISVVILSFLMFFSFAINTGLIINAKISVQAAADAAAYAGAAVQGRQLNAISFLNYDMREQYKKFIFRYVFVGSMGSPNFPTSKLPTTKNAGNQAEYDFEKIDNTAPIPPGSTTGILALKVPVVCIPLTSNGAANDNCLVVNLKNTANVIPSTSGGTNPIQDTLTQTLLQIATVQNSLCQGQGAINLYVLMSWLFRADTTSAQLTTLMKTLGTQIPGNSPNATQDMINAISPLLTGLGLYPRNIITGMRAHTVEGFLNQPHETAITADSVTSWSTASDSDARERTIQAFNSAAANLNTTVFDPTLTSMDELQADNLISLNDVLINFNAYVQHVPPGSLIVTQGQPTNCNASVDPFPAIGVPVGVQVNTLKVNYGVKVRAYIRPHGLMFLPNSDPLELDAYAGAKPFGARIGPAITPQFTTSITPPPVNGVPVNDCQGTAQCNVPLLGVGAGYDSYSLDYLKDLKNTATGGTNTFSGVGIAAALQHAMAPTSEEVGHYNILPMPKKDGDSSVNYDYIPYSMDQTAYRFYAPVYSSANAGAVTKTVSSFLDQIFAKTQVGNTSNPLGINTNDIRNSVQTTVLQYITSLQAPGTTAENGETAMFAAIQFPMPILPTPLVPGSKGFWLTQNNQVLSSWAPGVGSSFIPRFGYSVKFATLRDLQSEGLTSSDDDIATVAH